MTTTEVVIADFSETEAVVKTTTKWKDTLCVFAKISFVKKGTTTPEDVDTLTYLFEDMMFLSVMTRRGSIHAIVGECLTRCVVKINRLRLVKRINSIHYSLLSVLTMFQTAMMFPTVDVSSADEYIADALNELQSEDFAEMLAHTGSEMEENIETSGGLIQTSDYEFLRKKYNKMLVITLLYRAMCKPRAAIHADFPIGTLVTDNKGYYDAIVAFVDVEADAQTIVDYACSSDTTVDTKNIMKITIHIINSAKKFYAMERTPYPPNPHAPSPTAKVTWD